MAGRVLLLFGWAAVRGAASNETMAAAAPAISHAKRRRFGVGTRSDLFCSIPRKRYQMVEGHGISGLGRKPQLATPRANSN